MKKELEFKDYKVDNKQKMSSEFVNEVFNNFTNNMIYIYKNFQELNANTSYYIENLNKGLDWITREAAAQQQWLDTNYTFSGYSEPYNTSNITHDSIAGAYYLLSLKENSKIQRYTDEYNSLRAYDTTEIQAFQGYKFNNDYIFADTPVVDSNLRYVIDNHNYIWSVTLPRTIYDQGISQNGDYLKILISNASNESVISLLICYPFGGTEVLSINIKGLQNNADYIKEFNSKYPVKIVDFIQSNGNIELIIKGTIDNDKVTFAMRYIDIYTAVYKDKGYFEFKYKPTSNVISSITLNDDYLPEEYKDKGLVRIQIYTDSIQYDSSLPEYSFPLQTQYPIIPDTNNEVTVKVTLYKYNNISPKITYINIQ